MTVREFLAELAFPVRSQACLIAQVTFLLLFWLISAAGLLGIWLAVAVAPAYARYLVMIAEARALGSDAAPPAVDYFSLVGNFWTLFPVLPLAMTVLALASIPDGRQDLVVATLTAFVLLFPAMIGVLVITHSPFQSLNPVALWQLVRTVGLPFLYAPAWVAVTLLVLPRAPLPGWLGTVLDVYAACALHAVIGGLLRGPDLINAVDVPGTDALLPTRPTDLEQSRSAIANHAYALASRGNRDGGLAHVRTGLAADPEPETAWAWFFERMLTWDDPYPALYFGQDYLSALLAEGEDRRAAKLMLRCRLVDPAFRPHPGDLDRAVAAAARTGNDELVSALSAGTR